MVSGECIEGYLCPHIEQYHPDAHVGKPKRGQRVAGAGTLEEADEVRYEEIDRHVTNEKVSKVSAAAEKARF